MKKKKAAPQRRHTIDIPDTFIITIAVKQCRKGKAEPDFCLLKIHSNTPCIILSTKRRSALSEAAHSSQVYPQSHKLLVITIVYYAAGIHTVCIPYLESITSILCIGGDRTCSN